VDNTHKQTELIVASRANLLEIVVVAVGIALGVHLLAVGVLVKLQWSGLAIAILGGSLILIGCAYLISREFPTINRDFMFEGILPVIAKTHDVIPIDRYEFAEDTARHLNALAAENKALASAWADNPLSNFQFERGHEGVLVKGSPAAKLAREALEYFVLNELSLHLSQHFSNNPRIKESEIVTFGRRDIPSVLLENHFLELFSKPMEEREVFSPLPKIRVTHGSKVVFAMGKGGAIYDEFELILPRAAKISRLDPSTILIRTKRFGMQIGVGFDGFGANLPSGFAKLYTGHKHSDIEVFKIDLNIKIWFNWWSLLTNSGWEYYRWLDSFLDRMAQGFSFERFLLDIGWETALSAGIVVQRLGESRAKTAEVTTEKDRQPVSIEERSHVQLPDSAISTKDEASDQLTK